MPRHTIHFSGRIPLQSRPCSNRRAAFTLVEVVATVVILAVIGSLASRTLMTGMNGYLTAATRAQLHSELSMALDRMAREIRKIPIRSSYGAIAPNIDAVRSDQLDWGTSRLSRAGAQLTFIDNGASSAVLLSDVTAFSIQTYDESGAALNQTLNNAACDPIRRIRVQITLQRAGVTETLGTSVFLRCTMEGASS
jgi:prepilin-type N-terminal cleavage/methylation domain-containing protein